MNPVEICAEKIRATNDRFRYRDFYDLYMLSNKYAIDLAESVKIISKKEIRKPISKSNIIRNLSYALGEENNKSTLIFYKEEIPKEKIEAFFENLSVPDFKSNV